MHSPPSIATALSAFSVAVEYNSHQVHVIDNEQVISDSKYAGQDMISVESFTATCINEYAFENCENLEIANFPKARTIGENSFYECKKLKIANFPKSTSIAARSFIFCTSLEMAYFPQVITIGQNAFWMCRNLKEAHFPQSTRVNDRAFIYCNSLEMANFPKARTIGENAFFKCSELKLAYLPCATSLGSRTFNDCNDLKIIVLPDDLFNEYGEISDDRKRAWGIRESVDCIGHSDYIKSINTLIGKDRFKIDDDQSSEFLLLQKIYVYAVPSTLSEDEKSIFINCPASDVYKIVRSIDDYERKKQWARFLGIGEDVLVVNETLDTELDRAIIKYQDPLYEYLTGDDVKNLRRTSTSGDVNLSIGFNPYDDGETPSKKRQKSGKLKRDIKALTQRDINIPHRDVERKDQPRKKPQAKHSP